MDQQSTSDHTLDATVAAGITRREVLQRVTAILGGATLLNNDALLAFTFGEAGRRQATAGVGAFSAADQPDPSRGVTLAAAQALVTARRRRAANRPNAPTPRSESVVGSGTDVDVLAMAPPNLASMPRPSTNDMPDQRLRAPYPPGASVSCEFVNGPMTHSCKQ